MYIWYQLLVIANYVPGILGRVYMYVLIYLKQTNGAVYAYSVEYRGGCWNVSLRIYVTPGCTPKEVADLGSEEETLFLESSLLLPRQACLLYMILCKTFNNTYSCGILLCLMKMCKWML